MSTKYTKELLAGLVKDSVSLMEIIRKLGLREAGGTHAHISRKIKEFELDTSHFLGQATNCGPNHKGGPKRLTWREILVKREKGNRKKSHQLRRALIEAGIEYKCVDCGLSTWNGKELILQVDHKNQDWLDDRLENVEFRCPNCHSQTEGWCGRNGLVVKLADTHDPG